MAPAVRPASGRPRRWPRARPRGAAAPARPVRPRWPPGPPAGPSARRRPVPGALDPGGRASRAGRRTPAGASRCRRPGSPPASQASHQDSGVVQRRSSQLQCQTSISGGRRRIGRTQLTGPANGWLTDSRPPAASVASSQSSGSRRKSIQPISPSAPACPLSVVTSWPGSSVIPYRRPAAASSAWWLTVLWSVTARKSSPRPAARSGQFGDGQRAVRVHGVRVQVTGQPAAARPGGQRPARRPVPGRRRPRAGRRRPQARAERRGLAPSAGSAPRPAGRGARRSSPATSRPRSPRAGTRAWPPRRYDERLAGAARPAAEPGGPEAARGRAPSRRRARSRARPAARPSRPAPPPAGSARGTRSGPRASTARCAASEFAMPAI